MKIILVTQTLVTGGAETFVLRLANALHKRGNNIVLYVLRADKVDHKLIQSIANEVPLVICHIPYLKLILKLDGLLFLLKISFSVLRWLEAKRLRSFITLTKPDVLHSHLFTSDLVVAEATQSLGIPWVTTMHGDYLTYEKQIKNRAARILNFKNNLPKIEKSVTNMVCISDQQIQLLSRLLPGLSEQGHLSKIYNGYRASPSTSLTELPDVLSRIPSDAFVIGMVSRGIPEKGWEIMISAFLEVNLPNSWLVLVGDGDYLQSIRPHYQHQQQIIFTGNVTEPLRYINRFNVGCLPSQYKSESLPTVIIEYLCLGKPVIASNLGELSTMLNINSDRPAGLLIDSDSSEIMSKQLQKALTRISSDKHLREFLQENTKEALEKFDMDQCVDNYLNVYRMAQEG